MAMNLKEMIEDFKRNKNVQSLEKSVEIFNAEYNSIVSSNKLRIHGARGEGVFYVGSGRDAVHPKKKIIGRNSSNISEVAYSRAIFNGNKIRINDSVVDIVGYEAPLLRHTKGEGGNRFKLDLLGFNRDSNSIIAIECKFKVQQNTNPQYGLLESFFYAMAIRRHLTTDEDAVRSQICKCYEAYRGEKIQIDDPLKVKFCVVAPHDYWKRYLNNLKSVRDIRVTQEVIQNAINKNHYRVEFIGYVTIGCCSNDIEFYKDGVVSYPFINSHNPNNSFTNFGDSHC